MAESTQAIFQAAVPSQDSDAAGYLRQRLRLYFGLILAYIARDYASYSLPPQAGYAVTLALAAAVIVVAGVNLRWGLTFFTVLIILADDISRIEAASVRSMLTIPIAGVAIGNIVAMALIGMTAAFTILEWSRTPVRPRFTTVDRCILAILAIYALASLHGLAWVFNNPRGAVNDLNLPIMLSGLYFCARTVLRDPRDVARYFRWIVLTIAAKATVWLAYFVLGIGSEYATTLKVSNESGRILLVLLLAWGLVLQQGGLKLGLRTRLLGLAFAAIGGINLLVQAQRGPWLMAAVALLVLIVLGSGRDKFRWAITAIVCGFIVVGAILQIRPDAFATMRYHASTLRFWDDYAAESSQSTLVRVYEFRNIHAQLVDHDNLILGEGPGSIFTDRYEPFPFGLQVGDYSWAEQISRQFQNPHGLFQNLMLNVGYGGMILYLTILGLLYLQCYKMYRRATDSKPILLTLLAFLPAMLYYSWSPKNNMLLGLLLGIVGAKAYWQSRHQESSPNVSTRA